MQLLLLVGMAGFLGTVTRYLLGHIIFKTYTGTFPYATFLVNIIGCLIIGVVYGFIEKGNVMSAENRIILTTGFCGGFTTFSAFSAESFQMLREGMYLQFGLYAGLSVVLGIAATFAGFLLVKITAV